MCVFVDPSATHVSPVVDPSVLRERRPLLLCADGLCGDRNR